jgi:hypothetical protein
MTSSSSMGLFSMNKNTVFLAITLLCCLSAAFGQNVSTSGPNPPFFRLSKSADAQIPRRVERHVPGIFHLGAGGWTAVPAVAERVVACNGFSILTPDA